MSVVIEGMNELLRAFRDLPESLQTKVMSKWTLDNARRVAIAVARAAPKGKTGNLRKGIKAKKTGKAKMNRLGSIARAVATGFSPARHYNLVNVGSGPRFHNRSGRYAGRMPANPFAARAARPIVEQARADVNAGLARSVEKTLQAAVRRTMKRGSL